MMKKILCCFLLSLFVSSTVFASPLNGTYENKPIVLVNVDGRVIQPEVPAYIDGGSTMLPLRAVSEALGADVTWNQDTYVASVKTRTQVTAGLSLAQLNEIGNSVGLVYALDANGAFTSQGSGFLLDNGVFVTCWHVVDDAKKIRIDLNGQSYTVDSLLFHNPTTDLAGVKLNVSGGLKYTEKLPGTGEKVYSLGFPHAKFQITEGAFEYVNSDKKILHTSLTAKGSSGGILINSSGVVIGVNDSGVDGDPNYNSAIQMVSVQQELEKLK